MRVFCPPNRPLRPRTTIHSPSQILPPKVSFIPR